LRGKQEDEERITLVPSSSRDLYATEHPVAVSHWGGNNEVTMGTMRQSAFNRNRRGAKPQDME